MSNQTLIDLMILFQMINFLMIYLEKEKIQANLKGLTIDKKIGRTFLVFLPILVILSLLYRPF